MRATHQRESGWQGNDRPSHGIVFNHLYTLTNMPIQRFGSRLISSGRFEKYMTLLKHAYGAENLDLTGNPIVVADRCFGRTAGQSSSAGWLG